MTPLAFIDSLEREATSVVFDQYSLRVTENDMRFLEISIISDLPIKDLKKIFQNLQNPDYRFIYVETISSIFVAQTDRRIIRFKTRMPHPILLI